MKEAAAAFLARRRIAVTGVSRAPQGHGATPSPTSLAVDAVVIATRPDRAEATVREGNDLGVKQVWMHRAFARAASVTQRRSTGVTTG